MAMGEQCVRPMAVLLSQKMSRSLIAGQPMKTLGKRIFTPLSLVLYAVILAGCTSPPPTAFRRSAATTTRYMTQ